MESESDSENYSDSSTLSKGSGISNEEECYYKDLPARLGYPPCFVEYLQRYLQDPRCESGVATRPTSYFTYKRRRSLFRAYGSNKYHLTQKCFAYLYKLLVRVVYVETTCWTHATLVVYPKTQPCGLWPPVSDDLTVSTDAREASVHWWCSAPVGYYAGADITDLKGVAQVLRDAEDVAIKLEATTRCLSRS